MAKFLLRSLAKGKFLLRSTPISSILSILDSVKHKLNRISFTFCKLHFVRYPLYYENTKNSVNTTLFSIRRMGKTGLIHHVFNILGKGKKWKCIYADIYATQSLAEFTNQLASAIFKSFPPDNNIGKKFLNLIKGFSPIISYDTYTGAPEVFFNYRQPKQYVHSLTGLFEFLEQQKTQIIIAIDEFQQITN